MTFERFIASAACAACLGFVAAAPAGAADLSCDAAKLRLVDEMERNGYEATHGIAPRDVVEDEANRWSLAVATYVSASMAMQQGRGTAQTAEWVVVGDRLADCWSSGAPDQATVDKFNSLFTSEVRSDLLRRAEALR
ncbi:hypothetical protein [Poseidonocella sedimentorum]|uniref:Lipoprotein n=1 Tax=Poseidonocella sedimentorum TaxID=871652 RepID=A0A1I6CNL7_9RHOB|nr:hypothetical protein [Poseidonocella sedimentorum]SFQ94764.1 hypothetical protein SAMN04515673_10193 [Poseidonocella sedimentorum]